MMKQDINTAGSATSLGETGEAATNVSADLAGSGPAFAPALAVSQQLGVRSFAPLLHLLRRQNLHHTKEHT